MKLWNDQELCPDFKPVLEALLVDRTVLQNGVSKLSYEVQRLTKIIGDADGYYGDHSETLAYASETVKTIGVLTNHDKVNFIPPVIDVDKLNQLLTQMNQLINNSTRVI